MPVTLDETHDPARRSFVASANSAESEFPIQNLPLGVVAAGAGRPQRVSVAIGDQVLDLAAAVPALHGLDGKIAAGPLRPVDNQGDQEKSRPVWFYPD